MDTEFPGTVARPFGQFRCHEEYNYQQIGITLNVEEDLYYPQSIELLESSGIDFRNFQSNGISPYEFSKLLYGSWLIMNDRVTYVTFHSGSDFGYLVKMLNCQPLPQDENMFYMLLSKFFPKYYDIKVISNDLDKIQGNGLQQLSNELNIARIGPQHQAGSDALVPLKSFTALVDNFFQGELNQPQYMNRLYGLPTPNFVKIVEKPVHTGLTSTKILFLDEGTEITNSSRTKVLSCFLGIRYITFVTRRS